MTGETDPVPLAVRTSDLPVRAASAVVMVAIAGTALWLGGRWLDLFIVAVALAAFVEFIFLIVRATANIPFRLAGLLAGATYFVLATLFLLGFPPLAVAVVVGAVIFVDTFAYFFGRTIGGPKIAPRISPSKTWAGLLGGMIGATIWILLVIWLVIQAATEWSDIGPYGPNRDWLIALLIGAIIAIAAQVGDFFESWLKRKAGVKDSSRLIPGHGGVFDRIDGLLPVALLAGVAQSYL